MPDYEITLLFYNPNIEPYAEYEKRKSELGIYLIKASLLNDVEVLECEYDNAAFKNAALSLREEPEGGARCRMCFELRLRETAKRAKEAGYDVFTTTLSVSPHKDAKLLNEIGSRLSTDHQVEYLQSNFKTSDGFKRSVELSKRYDLYRQSYCGCKTAISEQ